MAYMTVEKINKIYPNNVQAVFDFSLEVKDGEFIVFVGPSGCGKSTVLRMIAGLEEISSGNLYIDEKKVNDVSPKDREIAMVFQNYALYAHMTVYQNMALSLNIRKEDSDYTHERVMWAADILGLTDYLNRKPAQLSGGQRQRVAVGRAMVRKPKIFLFDEPLSNLDAKLRGVMRRELKLLHNKLNATMIYVTHDQIEALTLADRIVIMKLGVIQQIGTPIEIYNKPNNLFVATFMGTPPMNILDGHIQNDGTLCFEDKVIDIKKHHAYETLKKLGYFGKAVKVGIRPEHVYIERACENSDHATALVDSSELLGAETLIYVKTQHHTIIAKEKVREAIFVGNQVEYEFKLESLYFFDIDTENIIS